MHPDIISRYLEPHRIYHNLNHISDMLVSLRGHLPTNNQLWAIWLHDIVYRPGGKHNEEHSAEMVPVFMPMVPSVPGCPEMVMQIIMDTKDEVATTTESPLVIDLDLLGFADFNTSQRNASLVRHEFGFLTDEQWRTGRIEFLRKMAQRSPFYLTAMFGYLSERAIVNIETELRALI